MRWAADVVVDACESPVVAVARGVIGAVSLAVDVATVTMLPGMKIELGFRKGWTTGCGENRAEPATRVL